MRRILKNKPLVEAIVELKWALKNIGEDLQIDPHYKIMLGRLYDRLSSKYPEHEQLPSALMPDEMSAYIVQHRFRSAKNDWPLVQIGPGILTFNETHKYIWENFRASTLEVFQKLQGAHPKPEEFRIISLMLRYIDAIEFDYESNNIFDFIRDNLKIQTEIPANLFKDGSIKNIPSQFSWQSTFKCDKPQGAITIHFATGKKGARLALIWETIVHSIDTNVQTKIERFPLWIDEAHSVADNWFFKMIKGELERRFSSE
jgi:uncharacterized protein (TIGR04255 family)